MGPGGEAPPPPRPGPLRPGRPHMRACRRVRACVCMRACLSVAQAGPDEFENDAVSEFEKLEAKLGDKVDGRKYKACVLLLFWLGSMFYVGRVRGEGIHSLCVVLF